RNTSSSAHMVVRIRSSGRRVTPSFPEADVGVREAVVRGDQLRRDGGGSRRGLGHRGERDHLPRRAVRPAEGGSDRAPRASRALPPTRRGTEDREGRRQGPGRGRRRLGDRRAPQGVGGHPRRGAMGAVQGERRDVLASPLAPHGGHPRIQARRERRRIGCRCRGGTASLGLAVFGFWGELEADWQRFYGRDLGRDLYGGRLSVRRLRVLVRGLPPEESAFKGAIRTWAEEKPRRVSTKSEMMAFFGRRRNR